MKQRFIVPLHSFIDVITNSSGELFVMDTQKSAEAVEEILTGLWEQIEKVTKDEDPELSSNTHFIGQKIPDMMIISTMTGKEILNGWWNDYFDSKYDQDFIKKDKTYLVIQSTQDNSIPYCLVELIENLFRCRRWHLG